MKNLLKIFEHICVWFVLLMIPHIFWTVPTTLRIILYEALCLGHKFGFVIIGDKEIPIGLTFKDEFKKRMNLKD